MSDYQQEQQQHQQQHQQQQQQQHQLQHPHFGDAASAQQQLPFPYYSEPQAYQQYQPFHPAGTGAIGTVASTEYVDFQQFVQQHNLHENATARFPRIPPEPAPLAAAAAALYPVAAFDFGGIDYSAAPFVMPTAGGFDQLGGGGGGVDMESVVRNSNLLATASEFVPQSYVAKTQPKQQQKPQPRQSPDGAEGASAAVAAAGGAAGPSQPAEKQTVVEQIAAQTEAIKLSPSQGAIRKTYTNGNGQQQNGNGSGGGRHQQQQQQQNARGSNQRGRYQPDEPPAPARSASNWRDNAAPSDQRQPSNNHRQQQQQQQQQNQKYPNQNNRRAGNNQPQHQQPPPPSAVGGSGRTQSQYNSAQDNRALAEEYGQSFESSAAAQNGATGGRSAGNSGNRNNPFNRPSRNAGGSNSRGDYQPDRQRHQASAYEAANGNGNGRQSHAANTPKSSSPEDSASAAGSAKFDKRKHPEFKANRNLKAPPPAGSSPSGSAPATDCSQRDQLIREIDAGRLECLVCCDYIKPFQSTWACSQCHHIIHLACIIRWANSSKDEAGWRCPACQHVTKPIPDAYLCFCGKQRNPPYNRNDVAHSCGDLCGKLAACPHSCTLLCHPGPCATCHAQVTRSCGCGRTQRTMQCCQKEEIVCSLQCDKLLSCGAHRCQAACHTGDCTACTEQLEKRCHCGKDRRQVACDAANNERTAYSCRKMCNRQLACKQHMCKQVCHEGACDPCALLPELVTACPCGAQPLAAGVRKSCTDPVPLCQALCGRPLSCGQPAHPHQCASRCHAGACPPCPQETAVRCRCGHMEQQVRCRELQTRSDDARCKKRCTKKRNCGKHKCNQECCIDVDHVCPVPCTFTLSCGKHKCDQTCHKGRCQRCMRSSFVELYCECGAEVIYPPVPCGSKRPACQRPCSRAHGCEHPVQHQCHAQAQCPPCMAFVAVRCYGGHEERKTIACSQGEFSCGLRCGKVLRCARHKCIKTCHAGDCEAATDICRQSCTKLRVMCGHKCAAVCHDGGCPDTACREQVEVLCQCGNRKAMRSCQEFANEYRRIASAKFATSMESMQQGGQVELADVLGPIKMSNNKTLDCNEECKVLERNRRLALGLQIRNPDTAAKYAPKYTEFAKTWARKDPQLVGMIHDKLTELVKLAKQSQQRSRSHSFPTMNWEKRQLVHELCQTFGIESVAYDAEPNRNVVATATRDTSWLPSLSLLEVLKRESGQRRIPVPMNNAWGVKR